MLSKTSGLSDSVELPRYIKPSRRTSETIKRPVTSANVRETSGENHGKTSLPDKSDVSDKLLRPKSGDMPGCEGCHRATIRGAITRKAFCPHCSRYTNERPRQ